MPRVAALTRLLLAGQGLYYLVTGLWPLLSMGTFVAVTGPKESLWLVQTVGALLVVIGATLLTGAARGRALVETGVLGTGSALAFLLVDVTFVAQGRIPAVYLLDAAVEAVLLVGWVLAAAARLGAPRGAGRPAG